MNFQEALEKKTWRTTIDEEIKVIKKKDTWELASLPKGNTKIGVKWVYKAKKNSKGKVEIYKAGLVGKGYSQRVSYPNFSLSHLIHQGIFIIKSFACIALSYMIH